jgi:hypothetical protein
MELPSQCNEHHRVPWGRRHQVFHYHGGRDRSTDLLERFSAATAYCTMAEFQAPLKSKSDAHRINHLDASESSWALKVEYYPL